MTSGLTRPSKLRLPESTAAATSLPSLTAFDTGARQRAAVADAGGAAVADHVEAERLEVGQQARLAQVLGHHLRAGREAGLDVRRHAQAARRRPSCASRPAASITDGFEVLVQLVIAAMTTAPCPSSAGFAAELERDLPRRCPRSARPKPRSFTGAVSACRNELFIAASGTRSCGRFGPGQARLDRREVELERVAEHRVGRSRRAEQPLLLAVALDQRRPRRGAAGACAGSAASRRRPGRSRRWRRTRAPCWRSWRGRPGSSRRARARRTRRTCRPRPSCAASG